MLLYDIFSKNWLVGKGSIYIYSDPHFGDLESYKFRHVTDTMFINDKKYYQTGETIWEDEDSVKCSMECFDEWQVKNINSKCGKNDTLILLGDIGDIEYAKKLKARYKILIIGNHDKGASNYKRYGCLGLKDVFDEKTVKDFEEGKILVPYLTDEQKVGDRHLFDEVYEGPLMINDRVILSHEPIPVPEYMFNIHGHVHNMESKDDDHHLNVCAEHINYTPVNLIKLLKEGLLKNIKSIHRMTIDKANKERKKKKCII